MERADYPIIICIVGRSGVGKSYIADMLEDMYSIHHVQSRTTRQPRYEGEASHTFVSNEEFDTYRKEDMVAYTTFGENRYCTLIRDINKRIQTYVIDCDGLVYLEENFSSRYNIFTVYVNADEEIRLTKVTPERDQRDYGRYYLDPDRFDYLFYNDYNEENTKRQVIKLVLRLTQKYDI